MPGAIAFGRLARRISTKSALTVALAGWIVIILLGVAIVPLSPSEHEDFDLRLSYREDTGDYIVDAAPDSDMELRWEGEQWTLSEGVVLNPQAVLNLPGGGTEHRRREVQPVDTRRRHGRRISSRFLRIPVYWAGAS